MATASLHSRLRPEVLDLVAARFRALGDTSRLIVLNALLSRARSVGDLADVTGLPQTTVSRHLGVLRRERIVTRRANGRQAIYQVVDPTIDELCRIVCGGLGRRLERDLGVLRAPSRPRPHARRSGRRGSRARIP